MVGARVKYRNSLMVYYFYCVSERLCVRCIVKLECEISCDFTVRIVCLGKTSLTLLKSTLRLHKLRKWMILQSSIKCSSVLSSQPSSHGVLHNHAG